MERNKKPMFVCVRDYVIYVACHDHIYTILQFAIYWLLCSQLTFWYCHSSHLHFQCATILRRSQFTIPLCNLDENFVQQLLFIYIYFLVCIWCVCFFNSFHFIFTFPAKYCIVFCVRFWFMYFFFFPGFHFFSFFLLNFKIEFKRKGKLCVDTMLCKSRLAFICTNKHTFNDHVRFNKRAHKRISQMNETYM